MKHEFEEVKRHLYYGSGDEILALVTWLIWKGYWYEGSSLIGIEKRKGEHKLRCAISPEDIPKSVVKKILPVT